MAAMMTLRMFARPPKSVPTATSWYLADLGEARGKQELFTRQSPQKLKTLREHAMIESAISSNRIEGVEIDAKRVRTVVFGKPALRDRDEEEVAGYRDALKLVHESATRLDVSEETILRLHRLSRGKVWDAGKYKEKNVDIIETYADGRARVRFKTVSAQRTPAAVAELITLWKTTIIERPVHPLVAVAAFNLDFLCIHPFRDGNGRASRLLLLLTCYHLGFEVGRYVSLERLIEQNKERYYETLEQSSKSWHEGKHDPWPYINYLFYILKAAYTEFEERVGQTAEPKGAKTALVVSAIDRLSDPFSVADIQRHCPGVGLDMIRKILKRERQARRVECTGLGRGAAWRKTAKWKPGNG
jgi:Fic family protein